MSIGSDDIEATTRRIADAARKMWSEIDSARRLPDELVEMLRDSGLLRAGAPTEVDGLELPPQVGLRAAEELARGDASTGWCVAIGITSTLLVAYLPPSSRDQLFGGGRGLAAGVWAPRGKGRSVDGGVIVSGRWAFCSGIRHADVMFAGCMVDEQPVPSVVALPTKDLQLLDNWHTLGLRGTGSNDSVADEVFVPADRVVSIFDGPVVDRPLYRFPPFGFFASSVAAPALGNARAAIDDLVELAGGKKGLGSTRTLAERSATQAAVAAAESALGAARAALLLRRSTTPGRPAKAATRSPSNCETDCAWRQPTRREHPPTWSAPCTTSRAAARSTTTHRCSDGSATRSPPPPTSRSTRRRASCPAGSCWASPPTRRCCEGAGASKPSCRSGWTGPTRKPSTSQRPWRDVGLGRLMDWRNGDLRRLRVGHRDRPSLARPAAGDRTAGGRRAQPGHARARRQLGRVADRRAVDVAIGASSPVIVAGWHDREWAHAARACARPSSACAPLFAGTRSDYDGRQVRSHGFRLRRPRPNTRIAVGAFGPAVTRVAAAMPTRSSSILFHPNGLPGARHHRRRGRKGRPHPAEPDGLGPGGIRTRRCGAAPDGCPTGALSGPSRVRRDVPRARLRRSGSACPRGRGPLGIGRPRFPTELLGQIGLAGSAERIAASLRAYQDAGADCVAVVPSTAEDPGGRAVLKAVAAEARASDWSAARLRGFSRTSATPCPEPMHTPRAP